ncbi:MAG TPA: NADP-dependent oxidoreductase [Steroidobacteraceae bacterium]|nr:NADP-dependent oxidoreductase [Steroidobacteraceae bacterium]
MSRRIVLQQRPEGLPTPACFRIEDVPDRPLAEGEVRLATLYLSLDPYMRGRMSEGPSYVEPVPVGEVMCGGAVSRVVESRAAALQPGDYVLGDTGWQDAPVVPAAGLVKLERGRTPLSWALGVMGMPGLTAYVGLLDIGQPKPGETVVVAAATGAVGAIVGQIARLKGCRVVGIAGGADKCDYAVRELGFDACVNHHDDDLPQRLAAACPKGIDVYFENVGGHVLLAVLPLLNLNARMPVCGVIAWYNLTGLPAGPDFTPMLMRTVLVRRVTMKGFIIFDHQHRLADFAQHMSDWLAEGRIKYHEDVVEGLEQAPQALIGLLQGANFGKLVVRVGKE